MSEMSSNTLHPVYSCGAAEYLQFQKCFLSTGLLIIISPTVSCSAALHSNDCPNENLFA